MLALYISNSSILLDLHRAIAPGLCLQSCTRAQAIKHNIVAYSDDTDEYFSAEHNSEFPMEMVVEDMRGSAKNLNNLIMISGGSLVLHNTSWRLLVWELERGELKLI